MANIASTPFLHLLEKLQPRERNFYLMMDAYNTALGKFNFLPHEINTSVQKFFESEILKILVETPLVYESNYKRNEMAEKSIENKHENKIKSVDQQFDDKLGKWASSFSSDDEDDIKRITNESDLSSDEKDNDQHKITTNTR